MNHKLESETMLYRIRLRGHLDQKWADWFTGFDLTCTDGITELTGAVPDQPSLHGLLARIRDLNLLLISLEQLERNNG